VNCIDGQATFLSEGEIWKARNVKRTDVPRGPLQCTMIDFFIGCELLRLSLEELTGQPMRRSRVAPLTLILSTAWLAQVARMRG